MRQVHNPRWGRIDPSDPALKTQARSRVAYALKTGRLVRKPCEVCGEERVQAHHDDYTRQLEVRWFCQSHHQQHHAALARAARGHRSKMGASR